MYKDAHASTLQVATSINTSQCYVTIVVSLISMVSSSSYDLHEEKQPHAIRKATTWELPSCKKNVCLVCGSKIVIEWIDFINLILIKNELNLKVIRSID